MQAGAGAGKTTTLVKTFLDFVETFRGIHDGEFPRIIITTFTRKATQEVKERLKRRALELEREDVFRYLGHRSRVHISTIHGVLSLFLARYGSRLGLSPDFRIAGDDEIARVGRRELRRLLAAPEHAGGLLLLEEHGFAELWRALEEWRETAGADSDARFVTREEFRARTVKHLWAFCSQAHRLASLIPGETEDETWREWGEMLKTLKPPAEDDDAIEKFLEKVTLLNEMVKKPVAARGKKRYVSEGFAEEHKKFRDEFWDELADREASRAMDPSYWAAHEERCRLFAELAAAYKERLDAVLMDQGWVSMADLEKRSLELIRRDPSAASAFANEWDYWMIDEYQDTSPVQVELLAGLIGHAPHFVVGDPQQSIYFFRGARSEVFFEKKRQFEERAAQVDHVAANHRSRAPLLEFFNDVFSAHPAFQPMLPRSPKEPRPEVPVADFRVLPKSDSKEENRQACALAVIEKIQKLLAQGAAPETICVLARKNGTLRLILNEARRRHLPVQLHTAGGFAERREIRDAVAFLRFLLNPHDNVNLIALLRTPWFHLPDDEILKFCGSRTTSYWNEALKLAPENPRHAVRRLTRWMSEADRRGLAATLRAFYAEEGLSDSADWADPSGRREANLWKLLCQLEDAQRQPGFNGLGFLKGLERSLSTEEGNEDGDATPAIEPKRVNLMTVHASKGLEFDHVIVANLHESRMSERTELFTYDEELRQWTLAEKDVSGKKTGSLLARDVVAANNQRTEEESLRVLYVAMTRAMQSATLVWIDERKESDRGERRAKTWASFLTGNPLFRFAEGSHDNGKYRYEVSCAPPSPHEGSLDPLAARSLRSKWAGPSRPPSRTVSATELLEAALVGGMSESPRTAEAAIRGLRVAQRGTDAHRLFESLRYAPLEAVRRETNDAALAKALDWVVGNKEIPLRDLISKGEVEWGFAARGDGFVLQGQIDLWGEIDGTVWLVDYKTGSLEHAPKAIDQLAIYAWALLKMGRLKNDQPVRLAAVYPLDKEIKVRAFGSAGELSADWKRLMTFAD